MKLSLAAVFLGVSLVARLPAGSPITVAVFDFQTSGEKLANKGAEAALLLSTQLAASPNVILLERQEIDKALGEQELGLSGTVSSATAAKVGALTGAKVLITGRMFATGAKQTAVVKVIGTETSRVFPEQVTFEDASEIARAMTDLAPKLSALLDAQSGALLAKVELPAARLGRMKKSLGERPLPSVSVSVPEQHLSRAVIDPAVETELKMTLQELGAEVFDSGAGAKAADVAISGEAFSEAAVRRGNLVSCRARVELKAVRRSDGKLLWTDRQTAVAVDLAEHIAAKSALENAARQLVERLAPNLTAP